MIDELRDKRMTSETQRSGRSGSMETTKDNNRNDMIVYAKDSIERFGDDFIEEILQYLTLEDKVRLECVSKQWRRLVFNKQFVINIKKEESYFVKNRFVLDFDPLSGKRQNSLDKLIRITNKRRQLNVEAFESVLKKCPNITKVYIEIKVKSEVISLIGQYCLHIKSLGYRSRYASAYPWINPYGANKTLDFFLMYGHKFEELITIERSEQFSDYNTPNLKYCPNLKTVSLDNTSNLFFTDKVFLPKLERINSFFQPMSIIYEGAIKAFLDNLKLFTDKYKQNIKTIKFGLSASHEELKTFIDCISRFENLQSLTLSFGSLHNTEPIDNCLSLIGQKWSKLFNLDLSFHYLSIPISNLFFRLFLDFESIKKIKIKFTLNTEVNETVEVFKHCKQLKYLTIDNKELTEDFFANIDLFIPNLQYLEITTRKEFSDSFIDSFHSMKNIQKVTYIFDNYRTFSAKYWYFGKQLSEVMSSPKAKDVIRVNDNCGLVYYQTAVE